MRPSLEAVGRFDPERAKSRFLEGFEPTLTREIRLGGKRVGFVVVRPVGDHLLLEHLYVSPGNQGCGLGSGALRAVIAEARAAKLVLRVGALKMSPSNAFYRKHGFELEREAEWDNYYALEPSEA
jgi:ribosomal protein S18 acetylase RimI-like enzyme